MKATGVISIPIYNHDLIVHYGNIESLKEALFSYGSKEKYDGYDFDFIGNKGGMCLNSEKEIFFLYIAENEDMEKVSDTVAHEIFHCAVALLNHLGMSISNDSEEAYAYLIGYMTKEIYKIFGIKHEQQS